MWAKVAQALRLAGDSRYDVEYRVNPLDGSWRWLSAWGTVEFEGRGENCRPVANYGALSSDEGQVRLVWTWDGRSISLAWPDLARARGPAVLPPSRG